MTALDLAGVRLLKSTESGRVWSIALAGAVLLAAVLRFAGIVDRGLWEDEFATLQQVRRDFWAMLAATARDTYPPGYNVLAWGSIRMFGETEFALRLPAALLGVAGVPAVFWLGSIAAGRSAGLIAAFLLAASPLAIAYAQDARAYTLLMLTGTLFASAAFELLAGPSRTGTLLAAVVGVLLLYSHPYGTLVFASVCAAAFAVSLLARDKRALLHLLCASTASVALFTPWAVILINVAKFLQIIGFWIDRPTPPIVLDAVATIVGGPVLGLAMVAILLSAALLALVRRGEGLPARWQPALAVLAAAALGPIVLGIGISLVSTPVFIARYVAASLPPLLVLVAGATAYVVRRKIVSILVAAVLAGCAGYAWLNTSKTTNSQDWRNAVARLAMVLEEGDCVVVPRGLQAFGLDFYLRYEPACLISSWSVSTPAIALPGAVRMVYLIGIASRLTPARQAVYRALPQGTWDVQEHNFGNVELDSFTRR